MIAPRLSASIVPVWSFCNLHSSFCILQSFLFFVHHRRTHKLWCENGGARTARPTLHSRINNSLKSAGRLHVVEIAQMVLDADEVQHAA